MTEFIFALVFLALAIGGVVVRKTYYYVPVHELKRQASRGDTVSEQLFTAVSYQRSLRALLWIYIGIMSALGFVLLSRAAPVWLSLLSVLALLWVVFHWLPSSRVSSFGMKLTLAVNPSVTWLLSHAHPLLNRTAAIVERRYTVLPHTGLFNREDVLRLVEQQKKQTDNRLTQEELDIIQRALVFSDHIVGDVMTGRKSIKTILAEDTVGPILIDELHKTGQPYTLVREKSKGDIIGTIEASRLGLHSSGKVKDHMQPAVYYLHESDTLSDALHAFYLTNHAVFVVTNSFEEFVGVITMDNLLKQLLGHMPGDAFDQYADIHAVASRHPKQENQNALEETPVKTDDEVLE